MKDTDIFTDFSDFISNGSVIIIGDETSSECNDLETITTDVADTRRRRRYTADATRQETARRRSALNGPLEDGVLYSAFLRAYVVVESDKVMMAIKNHILSIIIQDNIYRFRTT